MVENVSPPSDRDCDCSSRSEFSCLPASLCSEQGCEYWRPSGPRGQWGCWEAPWRLCLVARSGPGEG
jgi:hypothetical protein